MSILSNILAHFYSDLQPEDEQRLNEIFSDLNLIISSEDYITCDQEKEITGQWNKACNELKKIHVPAKHPSYAKVKAVLNQRDHLHSKIVDHNRQSMEAEKMRCQDLLSDIDGKSLDNQQRDVVVCDDDRNLVLAGAGSGKTLTIAGKVKYLCKVKNIAPEEILLIAFTRKSAAEITERIAERLGIPVQATTFHKLGFDIITAAEGKRPDVMENLNDFVRNYFEKAVLDDPHALKDIIEYFAYYLNIPANMDDFDSLGAAYDYEKGADFETLKSKYDRDKYVEKSADNRRHNTRTLKNEQVKSMEEVSIANFFFLNGVQYEYERLYPYESDDATRKSYRPDFYLPNYDIYIEHFGIARDGSVPWLSPIEEEKYKQDMTWKRKFHEKNGTILIESYSYYTSDGILLDKLEENLKSRGVQFTEPNFEDIFNSIYATEGEKYFSEFINLCCTFITLFKSNGYALEDLRRLHNSGLAYKRPFYIRRTELFKQIIAPILSSYEAYLADNNSIDFSDMINTATRLVDQGYVLPRYKWIIIDEYQDISMSRYKLVKSILNQTGAKLLCVGDDWQSIYRFAGSDISLFTGFEQYFGNAAIMRLEKTYRNSQQLIDEAGAFIMKNPNQFHKQLKSDKSLDYPITFMCYEDNPFAMLQKTINKILQTSGVNSSILFLGRTNYDFELLQQSGLFSIGKNGKVTYQQSPTTPMQFLSVHKAKGLEADNVVLLNFQNSAMGFPNKISDDPLLELVLTKSEDFSYAEERRLLYVALTRTKNRIFILTDGKKPSEFFNEFTPSQSVFKLTSGISHGAQHNQIACPRCKKGHLVVHKNESSGNYFVGCSNYPQCQYTVQDTSIMTDTRVCPQCGGFLVKRKGKFGFFYGCTNYPVCGYTEEIPIR